MKRFKPLLMMNGRGKFGPMFGRHYGVPHLSRSVGNYTELTVVTERAVLEFSGTQYVTLSDSFVTTAGYEVEFVYANTTSGTYPLDDVFGIVSDVLTGPASVTSILVDGVASTTAPTDGKLHTIKFIGSGVITVSKIAYDLTNYFIGVFEKVSYSDLADSENNQTHNFRSRNTQYELAEEGSLGSEMIVNGGFDTDLSGWTDINNLSSWENGKQVFTGDGVSSNGNMYQTIPVELDGAFLASVFYDVGTGNSVRINYDGSLELIATSGSGIHTDIYTYANASITIRNYAYVDDQEKVYFDNVSLKKLNKAVIYTNVTEGDWWDAVYNSTTGCWEDVDDVQSDLCEA